MSEPTPQTPPSPDPAPSSKAKVLTFVGLTALAALATVAIVALLINIFNRKQEARDTFVRHVEVSDDVTDPAVWGKNWPLQYDSYKRTAESTRTRFGGHGGSEALPEQKIERDPWLKRMFLGYAFSIDYRDRRGHAYMLQDQEETQRITKPQSGSCLHCHASVMPLYKKKGGGDVMKGFEAVAKMKYQDASKELHDIGHAHPVTCADCHDQANGMQLRITRPGFIRGIAALAASSAPMPAIPSMEKWRQGKKDKPYNPNTDATRNEMRSFVCGQCHVEYYCATKDVLFFPWGNGVKVEDIEKYYDGYKFPTGEKFYDYKHAETGADIYKAQHPEFELWSQGVHARSGVSCADCHMPYQRVGAMKVSDHHVRSPLLNINRACQTCHHFSEDEMKARVDVIQTRNYELMNRSANSLMAMMDAITAAKKDGVADAALKPALDLHRKAQWRIDFVAAENSMGFHAPQEAARILGEAIDYARQGEAVAQKAHLLHAGARPSTRPATEPAMRP